MPKPNPNSGINSGGSEYTRIVDMGSSPLERAWQELSYFLTEYLFLVIAFALFCLAIYLIVKKFHERKKQIEKLWIFTLFFLTKRQMMIPLVITLSKRDEILDSKTQDLLMNIRGKCREVSFKRHPRQRLKIEEDVSKILFRYFNTLEKEEKIKSGTKFEKIVKDLEFIDAKLVQLQKSYNQEVSQWNHIMNVPFVKYIFRIFRLYPFEAFVR